jgi:LAS superfamily LD-carboxypeptidase LdcB
MGIAPEAYPSGDSLFLVNKEYSVYNDFMPSSLVLMKGQIPLAHASIYLHKDAGKALAAMVNKLEEENIKDIRATSAYRDYDLQRRLFSNKISYYQSLGYAWEQAVYYANLYVAEPGKSEHQTGFAIDLTTSTVGNDLVPSFAFTTAGKWITENAHYFGFIRRYDGEKSYITGYAEEAWHFRYVGAPHAEYIYNHGLCLEEYFYRLMAEGQIYIRSLDGKSYMVYYCDTVEPENIWGKIIHCSATNTGGYIITTIVPLDSLYNIVGKTDYTILEQLLPICRLATRSEFVTMITPFLPDKRAAFTGEQQISPERIFVDVEDSCNYYDSLSICMAMGMDFGSDFFVAASAISSREVTMWLREVDDDLAAEFATAENHYLNRAELYLIIVNLKVKEALSLNDLNEHE